MKYKKQTLKPVLYQIDVAQIERLRAESSETGYSMGEIVRQAIDLYFTNQSNKGACGNG